jgi:hypothetical protein
MVKVEQKHWWRLLKFMGVDYYANKSGRMRFALWGLIPLVNAHSPDITRSTIRRFAGKFF